MSTLPFVIGVDGGGTKTAAWLAPLDDGGSGEILGSGLAGPGNPRAAGFDVAQANIAAAISAAFDAARIPPQTVVAACFGLAGAGRAAEQERITAWAISRGIAQRLQVTADAEPILAAATPENAGVVLICGTGSLAWGRNAAGETARSGGWGYLLGDEGSAYSIALAGLRAAMRAADGRGPATELLAAFQKELGTASPEEIVGRVYAPEMTRERLADLANIVFQCRNNDKAAKTILKTAAGDLAELAANVATDLRLAPEGYTLALAGGVLQEQPRYREQVVSWLSMGPQQTGPRPGSWKLIEEPVRGAIALARRLAGYA